jgi:hypothetical protein
MEGEKKKKQIPWSESASELYRPSDRRLSAGSMEKWMYKDKDKDKDKDKLSLCLSNYALRHGDVWGVDVETHVFLT